MREILQKTLEQITEETGLVGAVVALMKDGKVTFTHTYGYADREQGRPVTEESFFDIASCSKAGNQDFYGQKHRKMAAQTRGS